MTTAGVSSDAEKQHLLVASLRLICGAVERFGHYSTSTSNSVLQYFISGPFLLSQLCTQQSVCRDLSSRRSHRRYSNTQSVREARTLMKDGSLHLLDMVREGCDPMVMSSGSAGPRRLSSSQECVKASNVNSPLDHYWRVCVGGRGSLTAPTSQTPPPLIKLNVCVNCHQRRIFVSFYELCRLR